MTIKQALTWAYTKLEKLDSPQLDAEVLLSFVIKKDKIYLYTYPEKKLTANQVKKFKTLINKRRQHYPVAYLIKNKEFYGLNFYVDERVLIPRPATETLVGQAIQMIKKYKLKTVADIGTGSGCIAISLKKQLPDLKIYASDISHQALTVAKKNANSHKTKINFRQGNLLEPLKNIQLDVIIANLPYVDHKIYNQKPTIKHEPKTALLAKQQGLEFNHQLLRQIAGLTKKPRLVILELEMSQAKALLQLTKKINLGKVNLSKGLDGLGRFLITQI